MQGHRYTVTKPVHTTLQQADDGSVAMPGQSQDLINLLLGSFQLHQGKIGDEAWLELFTRAVACDAACCIRWTNGKPNYAIISTFGEIPELDTNWRYWVDRVINGSTRREPGFIEDFARATLDPELQITASTANPRILTGVVDWEPACITMLLVRTEKHAEWTELDRKRLLKTLGYVRESISVHKELDRRRYISGLASDILNSSPRGIIALSEDGVIQMANAKAETILDEQDGLSRKHDKLLFSDKKATKALSDHLTSLTAVTGEGLPEMDWNLVARRPSGAPGYQLILGSVRLREWNIESRHSDRVAIVYLHDRADKTRPTITQLRDFYGMTAAQARLAGAIYSGQTISDAADELHISINTARTHMRGIYARTGVNTQSELISLLASGLKSYGTHKD